MLSISVQNHLQIGYRAPSRQEALKVLPQSRYSELILRCFEMSFGIEYQEVDYLDAHNEAAEGIIRDSDDPRHKCEIDFSLSGSG